MDKYTIIKNGLVLSLDKKGNAGYFNIIIKNGKIFLIDYERKFNEIEFKSKNPDAKIIDASQNLVMPGFFNSRLISSYSLSKIFFRKCTYENLSSWLSIKLIDKYLSSIENAELSRDLLKISYVRSILNGEIFVNESSPSVTKDFFDIYFSDKDWIKNYYNLNVHDSALLSADMSHSDFISVGFRADEDVNNYTLSGIKKFLQGGKRKLIVDASMSQKGFESIKKVFGKPLINVLNDTEMVTPGTAVSNPTYISGDEIEILRSKKSTIILSPSDYANMFSGKFDIELLAGLNLITGTGLTGSDIMSELRSLSQMLTSYTFENIVRTAIYNPSLYFGISNVTGSIEKNKSADILFFDLSDLRNEVFLPEPDTECLCEFVVKNLTSKDISSVMLRGELLVEDRKLLIAEAEEIKSRAKDIAGKLFSAGKYFEFKEKYLMRGRVDKLLIGNIEDVPDEKAETIFVDMTETGDYDGEGEFTILGTKEEEFEKPHEKEKQEIQPKINLKEIKSLDSDLNLFDDTEQSQELQSEEINKQKRKNKKKALEKNQEDNIDIKIDEQIPIAEEKQESSQKSKMKFGFSDET